MRTNDVTAITVSGVDQSVAMSGSLDVDGVTTLDETTVDGTFDQVGGGQVRLSGNLDAENGADVTGALSLVGGGSPLNVNGTDGAAGDVLLSTGPGTTPIWNNGNGYFWALDGNSGTTAGTHFVGTTDLEALHLYVNNGSDNSLILNTNGSLQRDAGGDPRGSDAVDMQIDRE